MDVAFDRTKFQKALDQANSGDASKAFRALSSERINYATLFALLKHRDSDPSTTISDYPDLGEIDRGLSDIGKTIFISLNHSLHEFVCNRGEDKDLRDRVINAISGLDGGGLAVVTAVLVGLGVPAGAAPVAAVLVVKVLAKPAVDKVCQMWAQKLGSPPD